MEIRHNVTEQKFFVKVEGGECALKYHELSERLWNFESTSIPDKVSEKERISGKGVMEQMIAYAINFVKEHNIKILASCDDVQDFLVKHQDLKMLVYHPY